ncbi:hypothetical protein CRG98_030932 [Punica granatum]|uniref:Uncharacterized protein n=1 Tax=Punica granatum TaxID=22663 RepID=A0A2I0IXB9_PUNGR|nr:hypothetical protein CRG98_030932 [Punica granatum]
MDYLLMKICILTEAIGVNSLILAKRGKGPGLSVGNPNPTTKVVCIHRGCRRPWRWGRGLKLAAPTPESTGISNSRSRSIRGLGPPIEDLDPTLKVLAAPTPESTGISNLRSRSIRGLGPPIGDLDPTLEVFGVLYECGNLDGVVRIGCPHPQIDWDLKLEISIDLRARATNRRP